MAADQVSNNKRARANTAGNFPTNPDGEDASALQPEQRERNARKVREYVEQLDKNTLADIIIQAAETANPNVSALVDDAVRKIREKERSRVLDFDYYSKSVWKSINITYRSLSGSKQYDKAFDVADEVSGTVKHIAKQCGPFTNPKSRFNGLSVIRKICKTVALSSNDTLGHEVQKQFQWDHSLEDAMLKVVSTMSAEERREIRQDQSSSESLWPKLLELQRLGADYCLFSELSKVLDLLEGKESADGEYDRNGDEAEDEDQYEGTEDDYEDEDDWDGDHYYYG